MRWTKPKEGEIRVVSKFLLLPRTFNNEVRWLERVNIVEQYKIWGYSDFGKPEACWNEIGWRD